MSVDKKLPTIFRKVPPTIAYNNMKRSSSLKSFWTSEREWDTVNQQVLNGSKPMPSHRTVKRTFSGVLQLPRLSRRLSAQGDSDITPRKAIFSLGNGIDFDAFQSSW
ncbi:hypothetical protein F2P79_001582 [Pimephales promelas]|nr:hypothetical protein F2P79_001582 [Pimephales promelas]